MKVEPFFFSELSPNRFVESPRDKKNRSLNGSGLWRLVSRRALFTRTPQDARRQCLCATMPVDFTKNAEEHPEPQKAEVKGKISSSPIPPIPCFPTSERHVTLKDTNNGAVFIFFCAGNIPSWLQGTLLRNGPGLFSVGETSYQHWFDGMAIMNSFAFKDGASLLRPDWKSALLNKSY